MGRTITLFVSRGRAGMASPSAKQSYLCALARDRRLYTSLAFRLVFRPKEAIALWPVGCLLWAIAIKWGFTWTQALTHWLRLTKKTNPNLKIPVKILT